MYVMLSVSSNAHRVRRGSQSTWSSCYRTLLVTLWVLGIKTRPYARLFNAFLTVSHLFILLVYPFKELFFSSFSKAFMCIIKLCGSWASNFVIQKLNIKYPVRITFSVSHRFWNAIFLFCTILGIFKICFLIFPLIQVSYMFTFHELVYIFPRLIAVDIYLHSILFGQNTG